MKMKLSGGAAQINCVVGAALLTLVILSSNNVPDPESGVRSSENADMRSVLIGPGPGQDVRRHVPVIGGESSVLHRLALEGDHSFVEGEITLESNQLVLRIDGRRGHLGDEVGRRWIDGGIRQRHRCYRHSNLISYSSLLPAPGLVTVTGHPAGKTRLTSPKISVS